MRLFGFLNIKRQHAIGITLPEIVCATVRKSILFPKMKQAFQLNISIKFLCIFWFREKTIIAFPLYFVFVCSMQFSKESNKDFLHFLHEKLRSFALKIVYFTLRILCTIWQYTTNILFIFYSFPAPDESIRPSMTLYIITKFTPFSLHFPFHTLGFCEIFSNLKEVELINHWDVKINRFQYKYNVKMLDAEKFRCSTINYNSKCISITTMTLC